MAEPTRTALGSARERFVRGLHERGRELAALCAALERAPNDAELTGRLLGRLHALYASAQVFADRGLLSELGQLIASLEAARDLGLGPGPEEFTPLYALIARLCGEAAPDPSEPGTEAPAPEEPARASRSSVRPAVVLGAFATQHGKPAVAVTQSVAGTFASPQIIAVLALVSPKVGSAVRAALPIDRCELTTTHEPETALSVIDQVAPDLVLIESGILAEGGEALVRGLRGARAGAPRAVVALVSEPEAEVEALLQRTHADAARRVPVPGDGFLERVLQWSGRGPSRPRGLSALTAGTVDEIARSVAEEVRRGIADSLRSGRSERLELDDKSELMAAAWSAVARIRAHLAEEAEGRIRFEDASDAGPSLLALTGRKTEALPTTETLVGRRILIADDHPVVLRVFAELLRAKGAQVLEVENGARALEAARNERPDLVISDILMPELDGFSLCRELKRDIALRDVPVILLSWKEDFLQRMRELDAGASGYLRKEADAAQILSTVFAALRPQTELAQLLRQGGEVQGRCETIGVPRLLESIADALPDARMTLRDAWNMFEVDIRGGTRIAITRTASDGSFVRGASALRQLLGVEAGRFAVTPANGPLRFGLDAPLRASISEGVAQLGALLDAVSDSRLLRIERVSFDDEVLSSLLTATPTALADLVGELRVGTRVADLLASGRHTPRELEQQLRDLARHGAIVGVRGIEGEDLVASARVERELRPIGPESLLPDALPDVPVPLPDPAAELEPEFVRPRRELVMSGVQAGGGASAGSGAATTTTTTTPTTTTVITAATAMNEVAETAPEAVSPSARPSASRPPEAFSVQSALLRAASQAPRSVPPAAWGRARPPPLRLVGFGASLLALIALGFFGWRTLRPRVRPELARSALSTRVSALEGAAEVPADTAQSGPKLQTVTRALPYIDPDRRAGLGKDEGLLVVQYSQAAGVAAPRVKVGGRDYGPAPVTTALPSGRHEVLLKRGDQTSFRYVVIHPGETRILELSE